MTETIRAASGATPPENLPGEHSWQGPLVREIPEEERDDRRCWVALRTGPSTTGEHCEGMAAYEVYGIPLCEDHGAESKAAALQELYFHASEDLIRPFNPHVALLQNRATAWALRRSLPSAARMPRRTRRRYSGVAVREEFTDPETLGYAWSIKEAYEGGPP